MKTPESTRKMLFGLWNRVVRENGWSAAEAGAQRDELTIGALEVHPLREAVPSWGALKEGQIDALKGALKAVLGELDTEETPGGVECGADARKRRQLIYGTRKDLLEARDGDAAAMEHAVRSICEDVYRHRPDMDQRTSRPRGWETLPLEDLRNLRKSAARILRRKQGQKSKTGEISGVECPECPV